MTGRTVEIGVPAAVRSRASGELDAMLRHVVSAMWSDAGLWSEPSVSLVERPAGSVAVDGRALPLSPGRVEAAVLAGTGRVRRPDEPPGPAELLAARLLTEPPSVVSQLVAAVADARLRVALTDVIGNDRRDIARRLLGPGGPTRLDVLAEAVLLASDLGISAAWLVDTGTDVAGADDPYLVAESMARSWLGLAAPRPTIELDRATLRRLTSGDAGELSTFRYELRDAYGVGAPPVALAVVDGPASIARFAFGPMRTAGRLVLSATQRLVTYPPLPLDATAVPYLDAVGGEEWSLVDGPLPELPSDVVLGPAAALMRDLLAEIGSRMAWWLPVGDAGLPVWPLPSMAHHPGPALDAALRRMLASQVPLLEVMRISEEVVDIVADGVAGVEEIEARLRRRLGPPVAFASRGLPATVVEIPATVAAEAVRLGSADVLVEHCPDLPGTAGRRVATCPAALRREVERLLRPLGDVVAVMAVDEAGAHVAG